MTEFLLPERQVNERADLAGLDIMDASWGAGFGAAFTEGVVRNPFPTIARGANRLQYLPSTDEFGNEMAPRTPSRMLTPDEANEKYGIAGHLKFDADIPEPIAQELRGLKQREMERQDTLRRAQSGLGTQLTAGVVSSILDPLNVGLAFIPVVGQARFAAMAARVGVPGARVATGAVEGAVGAALLEPIVLAGAAYEQADYDITDSLANVAFGGIIGGGLHLAGGAIMDRLAARREASAFQRAVDDLPRADQEALMRTAVAQVVEGRPVDVGPVMDASPTMREMRVREEVRTETRPQDDASPVDLGDGAPPLPPETVRLYHGGSPETVDGPLWVTRSFEDAQGWASRSEDMRVWYVDVPANDPRIAQFAGDMPNGIAPVSRFELPAELAASRKVADQPVDPQSPAVVERQARAEREAEVQRQLVENVQSQAARRYIDPDDAIAADTTTRRIDAERTASREAGDEVANLEAELKELDTLTPADAREGSATSAAEKEANIYAKAWREAAACAVRKG